MGPNNVNTLDDLYVPLLFNMFGEWDHQIYLGSS